MKFLLRASNVQTSRFLYLDRDPGHREQTETPESLWAKIDENIRLMRTSQTPNVVSDTSLVTSDSVGNALSGSVDSASRMWSRRRVAFWDNTQAERQSIEEAQIPEGLYLALKEAGFMSPNPAHAEDDSAPEEVITRRIGRTEVEFLTGEKNALSHLSIREGGDVYRAKSGIIESAVGDRQIGAFVREHEYAVSEASFDHIPIGTEPEDKTTRSVEALEAEAEQLKSRDNFDPEGNQDDYLALWGLWYATDVSVGYYRHPVSVSIVSNGEHRPTSFGVDSLPEKISNIDTAGGFLLHRHYQEDDVWMASYRRGVHPAPEDQLEESVRVGAVVYGYPLAEADQSVSYQLADPISEVESSFQEYIALYEKGSSDRDASLEMSNRAPEFLAPYAGAIDAVETALKQEDLNQLTQISLRHILADLERKQAQFSYMVALNHKQSLNEITNGYAARDAIAIDQFLDSEELPTELKSLRGGSAEYTRRDVLEEEGYTLPAGFDDSIYRVTAGEQVFFVSLSPRKEITLFTEGKTGLRRRGNKNLNLAESSTPLGTTDLNKFCVGRYN